MRIDDVGQQTVPLQGASSTIMYKVADRYGLAELALCSVHNVMCTQSITSLG